MKPPALYCTASNVTICLCRASPCSPVKLRDFESAVNNFEKALERAKLVHNNEAQQAIISVSLPTPLGPGCGEQGGWALSPSAFSVGHSTHLYYPPALWTAVAFKCLLLRSVYRATPYTCFYFKRKIETKVLQTCLPLLSKLIFPIVSCFIFHLPFFYSMRVETF